MPRHVKVGAGLTFGLALVFFYFFQTSKHLSPLVDVNPFAEDPYDAVGSFGIQVALLTALLSLLRAFRPYQPNETKESKQQLFLRAASLCCISIGVTLVADLVAMIRHLSVWLNEPAGFLLVVLLGTMALLIALVSWFLHHSMSNTHSRTAHHHWIRVICLSSGSILILAFYPENWRQTMPGGLFTVFVGMAFLFGLMWILAQALFPEPLPLFEDCIDDLTAMYRWLKARAGPFVGGFHALDKILSWFFVRAVGRWLNPRTHPWNAVFLLGIVIGAGLLLAEMLSEGGPHQIGQLVLVTSVFLGIESMGVLLGYALLAKPLGLFRHTADSALSRNSDSGTSSIAEEN